MPIKVAFMQLTSCWGCHQSLLNAHLGLLPVLPELDIVYWPAVVDYKLDSLKAREDGEIDVGFVEGCIRTKQDTENLKLFRAKCKYITTFGTCACMGSVAGLANNYPLEDLIKRKFMEVESITTENPKEPTEHLPGFEKVTRGIDQTIKIEAYIPGCPPKTESLVSILLYLLGRTEFPKEELPFCNDCGINNAKCLLESGTLCFGSITSSGCSLKCTDNGNPCVGCRGPSMTVGSRIEILNEFINDLDNITPVNRKALHEFFTLFSDNPLMGSNYPLGPVLTEMPSETDEIVNKVIDFLREDRFPNYIKMLTDFSELSSVCDTCPRIRGRSKMTEVKRDYEGLPNEEDCLLEQGYICLGAVTSAGCGGQCIKVNAPCTGCYGPIKFAAKFGRFREMLFAEIATKEFNVGLSKAELLTQIKDPVGTFHKFSMSKNVHYRGGYKGKLPGQWWLDEKNLDI